MNDSRSRRGIDRVDVHLVDGTYELFRAYYGAPGRAAPDGSEIGATLGLARTLLLLVQREGATHVAVAFDTVIESFRNELFDGYKTGDGIDPGLRSQFPAAEEMTRALGMVTWPMVEFEADDALATAAARYGADRRVGRVHLCTPDKDLAQCVAGDRIVMVDRRRRTVLDEEGVRAKFGVAPGSIPDWLALVGDDADGIPGLPGWGAKRSAAVLSEYGRLEAIPAEAGEWSVPVRGAERLAETLVERREEALLYRRLATLRTDVPLSEGVGALEWRGARRPELEELCERWGDARLLERVGRWT
jgi:5'-3' exonuclease